VAEEAIECLALIAKKKGRPDARIGGILDDFDLQRRLRGGYDHTARRVGEAAGRGRSGGALGYACW